MIFVGYLNFILLITDDKKLGGVLKKMGLTEMKGMEEVNIFKNDGTVVHIKSPKRKLIKKQSQQPVWNSNLGLLIYHHQHSSLTSFSWYDTVYPVFFLFNSSPNVGAF